MQGDIIVPFSDLIGETIESFLGLREGSSVVAFVTKSGTDFHLFSPTVPYTLVHEIRGDFQEVLGSPLTTAEVGVDDTGVIYTLKTATATLSFRWTEFEGLDLGVEVQFAIVP